VIQALTFDAFGTLIDTGRDVLIEIARTIVADHRRGLDAEAFLDAWDRHFFAADPEQFQNLAEVTEDSLASAFRDYGIDAEPRPYVEMLERRWLDAKAYPEVRGALARLDGIPRAVVSNADDAFLKGILTRNSLDFDAVITSEFARCYKPRPRIFEIALDALRVDPGSVVHVGDSLAADVAGARRLGMQTIWVNRGGLRRGAGDPKPHFVVDDLEGVPPIVATLRGPRTMHAQGSARRKH